jgi:hypothetical protein
MICERCKKEFFEDWRKDKQSRKNPIRFCSRSCSNKRQHSEETKKKISKALIKINKFCISCNMKLNWSNKSGFCSKCKKPSKTRNELMKTHRENIKLKLIELKGNKCILCGYFRCIKALEFHHTNPKEKDYGISMKVGNLGLEKIKIELKKCILVCSNCHKEIHNNMINLGILV